MQVSKLKICLIVLVGLLFPYHLMGQSSSINTFSPYTFHGVGDLSTQGLTATRSMGGASMGFRNSLVVNYTNPAAYSAVGQRSFLFHFGMEGGNYYLKNEYTKSSFNTFNVRDIAIQFPLARKLGFAFSVTPYSSVGYRVRLSEETPLSLADIGRIDYAFDGSGGINQFKAGIGWELFRNFSIGAEAVYYLGTIERLHKTEFTVITGEGNYANTEINSNQRISRFFGNFGAQYTIVPDSRTAFTVGATYTMGGELNSYVERYVPSNGLHGDTVSYKKYDSDLALASTYGIGFYFHKMKYSIGADYIFSDWGKRNKSFDTDGVEYRNTHTFKGGMQYTPNPGDIRSFIKRWTYRVGYRYNNYYLNYNGHQINEHAVTFGVGVPLKMAALNSIDVGLEFGTRGMARYGLTKENYFKFSIGFSLFGEDYWFVKHRYE